MSAGLIARKLGMSLHFLANGEAVPVTYLQVEPNVVVRMKTAEKDGYNALVLGIGAKKWKTRKGHEHTRYQVQKEWQVDSLDGVAPGALITAEVVPVESLVTVSGVSKGKGFQGGVKRYGFAGGPASHGSHFKREPGSVGMRQHPGRIHKGKRMAGHMGGDTVTICNRPVLVSDSGKGILAIKGPVPGPNGAAVYVTVSVPAPTKAK
ncbi:MAG: 50S ribosomal protein L3 [Candidatus Peribacteraceae bacterium]|nr:50S ribosomal protein L3 [Candidatus Peribacteraceae bacterium]